MEFQNVAAIVTGGASGLGEGAARALAAAGCKVAIFDLQKERGEAVAKELGGIFVECDVSSAASAERHVFSCLKKFSIKHEGLIREVECEHRKHANQRAYDVG